MALKFRKNYTIPYSKNTTKAEDYWLEWLSVSGKQKSCLTISDRIPMMRVLDNETFFLFSMNKKRDVIDCYKTMGRQMMIDYRE